MHLMKNMLNMQVSLFLLQETYHIIILMFCFILVFLNQVYAGFSLHDLVS